MLPRVVGRPGPLLLWLCCLLSLSCCFSLLECSLLISNSSLGLFPFDIFIRNVSSYAGLSTCLYTDKLMYSILKVIVTGIPIMSPFSSCSLNLQDLTFHDNYLVITVILLAPLSPFPLRNDCGSPMTQISSLLCTSLPPVSL